MKQTRVSSLAGVVFALLLMVFFAPVLHAQVTPGYAVIDGTKTPPEIVFSDINISVTDPGTGWYILEFDEPVVFFTGTAFSKGPAFDVGSRILIATIDSTNERRVSINTRDVTASEGHSPTDAWFSVKVLSIPIFLNGFENQP